MLFDRFGPRRTIPGLLVFAVAGTLVFAAAEGRTGLIVGRALIGLGCSGILVGALLICARYFPRERYATFAAILVGVGESGNLLATRPFASVVDAIGWRGAFIVMAGVTAALAALAWIGVRDAPPGHPFHQRAPESLRQSLAGLGEALRQRLWPRVLAAALVIYGAAMAVFGLWGGPYFNDVHGLDPLGRGDAMFVMALAMLCGSLTFGPLDRLFDTRKRVVEGGLLATTVSLAALALWPAPPLWAAVALFALLGAMAGGRVVVRAHGRAIFPERLRGRGVSLINMGIMGGVALTQFATGALMAGHAGAGATEGAYRLVFAFLSVVVLGAWAVYRTAEDRPPSGERGARGQS